MAPLNLEIETAQLPFELEQMLAIAETIQPKRILEIGTWHGGTLWHWLDLAPEVVAVDDEVRRLGDWHQWAVDKGSLLYLVQGDSRSQEVIAAVANLAPFDLCFIDADHTLPAVTDDWTNYAPMVRPGGMVIFHDILERPDYGVWQLWRNLQGQHRRTIELREAEREDYCGIGCVYV